MYNSNSPSAGRLGNQFFRNMASHFLAKKNNIKYTYGFVDSFDKLGISFFMDGEKTYEPENTIPIKTETLMSYIEDPDKVIQSNMVMYDSFYQEPSFCFYLKDYFYGNINQTTVMAKNPYYESYENNNDVYVHVRLGDITHLHSYDFNYYNKVLEQIYRNNKIQKGYISSDSVGHPTCQQLIQKYNLIVFHGDEVNTIQFGSTCKHIVLSNGTFSWLIGFLSFGFSNVYYPDPTMKNIWHGDIFVFPEWNKVTL